MRDKCTHMAVDKDYYENEPSAIWFILDLMNKYICYEAEQAQNLSILVYTYVYL